MQQRTFVKISVVVTSYGKPRFLRDVFVSLRNQTLRPYEVICVDDGSPAPFAEEAKKMAAQYGVRAVMLGENRGPSGARNVGIECSTGEWIQVVDGDDYLTPRSLECRAIGIRKARWIAGQMVKVPQWCGVGFHRRFGRFLRNEVVKQPHEFPQEEMHRVRWHHNAILYHRSMFEQYGMYDERLRVAEDKELRWRFLHFSGEVPDVVSETVYVYRQGRRFRLTQSSYMRKQAGDWLKYAKEKREMQSPINEYSRAVEMSRTSPIMAASNESDDYVFGKGCL